MNIPGYTLTILLIEIINLFFIYKHKKNINFKKLIYTNIFCIIGGIIQIYILECVPKFEAWYFNRSSIINIFLFEKIAIEDIVFVHACTNLFYYLKYLFKKYLNDFIWKKKNINITLIFLLTIMMQILWAIGGESSKHLIAVYIIPILIFWCFYKENIKIHWVCFYLMLISVCLIGFGWDFLNVTIFKHWFYNKKCSYLSQEGFFFKDRLHISISITYNITGFLYFYIFDELSELISKK